jgi:glycosyltransferase involved in cell wall biosynthesis
MPISGVGQYVCSLSSELAALPRLDLKLLTLEFGKDQPLTEFPLPQKCLRHLSKVPRKVFNIAAEHLALPVGKWACGDVDVVHNTFFGWLPSPKRTAVVSTIHDVIPIEQPKKFTRTNAYYSNRNFWRQLSRSHAIIAVSEFTKKKIIEVGHLEDVNKIVVIPNGVRNIAALVTAESASELKTRLGIRGPYVLYVGNIESRKGVATLLRAFRRLRVARDLQLVVAGRKCWGFEEVEDLASKCPAGQVVMPGYVTEAEKAALMSHALVFVYPSTYEGFGIPILEAMQCGTPVIAAENSSMTELCRGAGELFETESCEDLEQKLARLLSSDSERKRLAEAGRIRAAQYTWQRAARETAQLYWEASKRI